MSLRNTIGAFAIAATLAAGIAGCGGTQQGAPKPAGQSTTQSKKTTPSKSQSSTKKNQTSTSKSKSSKPPKTAGTKTAKTGGGSTASTASAAAAPVYKSKCATCHGAKLQGGAGPALNKGLKAHFGSESKLLAFISKNMPFNAPGSLTKSDYKALATWLWGKTKG